MSLHILKWFQVLLFKTNNSSQHYSFVSTIKWFQALLSNTNNSGGCPRGVTVKAMDCGIVVSEFVLQSHYYVHFQTNTLGKGMIPLILPAMG